jgi:hypothetical protein
MGYRYKDEPKPKPEDMLPRFSVRNGTIVDIAFPCFYPDIFDRCDEANFHQHAFWPIPYALIDFAHPHPIDLTSDYEGYDEAIVAMDETVPELELTARIDEDETNVIYLCAKANFDMFEDKPKEYRFTLLIHAPARIYQGEREHERLDQVVRGIIVVLPGNKI